MSQTGPMHIIARIRSDFPTKFGIPRQSGLADAPARIVFEPEYRNADALRGIEGFSHLWLIWQFSEAVRDGWSPTVRPPKLGGNRRMGVFATRSPFRPNAIGLSSVRLDRVDLHTPDGPVLHVSGADLMDGTPIFDIKPYLAYTDAHPKHPAALHCKTVTVCCKYAARTRCSTICPQGGATRCLLCWRRTRVRAISTSQGASMASRSRAARCAFPSRAAT